MTTDERLHLRWLTFCEVKPYPRDTNEIIEAVIDRVKGETISTGLIVCEELGILVASGAVIEHAWDEAQDIGEVRLSHENA